MAGIMQCRRLQTSIVVIACLTIPACGPSNKKLTLANFEKIATDMPLADVQKLLGGPGEEDADLNMAEGSSVAGAVGIGGSLEAMTPKKSSIKWYKWGTDSKFIKVAFVQDKVAANNFKQAQGLK